jgi:hypothetical protein
MEVDMASTGFEQLKTWLPVLVIGATIVGTGYVTLERQAALAGEVEDQSESIDEIEEDVQQIQRKIIERQGEVELRTQRIEIEQQSQSEDLEEILRLLRLQQGQQ